MTDPLEIAAEKISKVLAEAKISLQHAQNNEKLLKRAFEAAVTESQRAHHVIKRLEKTLGDLYTGISIHDASQGPAMPNLPDFMPLYIDVCKELMPQIAIIRQVAENSSSGETYYERLKIPVINNVEKCKKIAEKLVLLGILQERPFGDGKEFSIVPLTPYRKPEYAEAYIVEQADESFEPIKISSLYPEMKKMGIGRDEIGIILSRMIVDGLIVRQDMFDANSTYTVPVKDWRSVLAELPLASEQLEAGFQPV